MSSIIHDSSSQMRLNQKLWTGFAQNPTMLKAIHSPSSLILFGLLGGWLWLFGSLSADWGFGNSFLWVWRKTVIGFTSLFLIPPIPALEKFAEKGFEILWVRVPSGKRERSQNARVDKLPSGGKCPSGCAAPNIRMGMRS